MKLSIFPLAWISASLMVSAQTASSPESYPGGAPLNPLKDAAWTVTYSYQSPLSPGVTSADGKASAPLKMTYDPFRIDSRIHTLQVTKVGDTVRELYTYENGKTGEKWDAAHFLACRTPEDVVIPIGYCTPAHPAYMDYSNGDFPGFGWVKPSNFSGRQKIGQASCLVFKETRNSLETSNVQAFRAVAHQVGGIPVNREEAWRASPTRRELTVNPKDFAAEGYEPKEVICQAFVDETTRLPVMLVIGDETWQYTFAPAPAQPPEPTGALAIPIHKWITAVRNFHPRHDVP